MARVSVWLARCLGSRAITVESLHDIRKGSGCEVWDCLVGGEAMVLKVYAPGFDDYSRLGPVDTARKHALALMELPVLRVPTARCLGLAGKGGEAAVVMEKVTALRLTAAHRVEAARVLARLHSIDTRDFSYELADLVSRSTPNRGRLGRVADEPVLGEIAVQHGDYFAVNLAATAEGLRVLDWDLMAMGDPMWDLSFLLEADRAVAEGEAACVVNAYRQVRPVWGERLAWHRACWQAFWKRRETGGSHGSRG
jgi:aminoglycoside phosphotransferase (APT) family kinase protein